MMPDAKIIHQDVAMLLDIGLVTRRDDTLIEVPYDQIVSEIRLAAA